MSPSPPPSTERAAVTLRRALSIAARRKAREYYAANRRDPVAYVITHEQANTVRVEPPDQFPYGVGGPVQISDNKADWTIMECPALVTTDGQKVPGSFVDLRHVTADPTVWQIVLRCPDCGRTLDAPDLTPDSPIAWWMELSNVMGAGCDHEPTPVTFTKDPDART